jgi:hypothetical protein
MTSKHIGQRRGTGGAPPAGRSEATATHRTVLLAESLPLPETGAHSGRIPAAQHPRTQPAASTPPLSHRPTVRQPDVAAPAVEQVLDHLRRLDPFSGPLGWGFGTVGLVAVAMIATSFALGRRRT